MGKPFEQELSKIEETIEWSNNQNIKSLSESLMTLYGPIVIIGSGGSFSACVYLELLFESKGLWAKSVTPLEFLSKPHFNRNVNVIFISARGMNKDILNSFRAAVSRECKTIVAITMNAKSRLTEAAKNHRLDNIFSFSPPAGKDGFLATNSLVAYFTLFYRVFQDLKYSYILDNDYTSLDLSNCSFNNDTTLLVIYNSYSKPAALDFESKCSEAALFPVLLADFRNFAHGRHNWFNKKENSIVVSFANQDDRNLKDRTLDKLPKQISCIDVSANSTGVTSTIDLLIKSFFLINRLSKIQEIDPGKPRIPKFGRDLYNLSYLTSIKPKSSLKSSLSPKIYTALSRKFQISDFSLMKNQDIESAVIKYRSFISQMRKAKFTMLAFDYDGTLCSTKKRFDPPPQEIIQNVWNILSAGVYVCVVSGRGDSLRDLLQKAIPQQYWQNVIVGYYNGADIGLLSNNELPNSSKILNSDIEIADNILSPLIDETKFEYRLRPNQISIFVKRGISYREFSRLLEVISGLLDKRLKVLRTSHSIDIIPSKNSKLSALSWYYKHSINWSHEAQSVLCIGDRGKYPGNDYELLSTPFSLSVDEVSHSLESCWNLAPVSTKNFHATLYYLTKIELRDGFFKIKI